MVKMDAAIMTNAYIQTGIWTSNTKEKIMGVNINNAPAGAGTPIENTDD